MVKLIKLPLVNNLELARPVEAPPFAAAVKCLALTTEAVRPGREPAVGAWFGTFLGRTLVAEDSWGACVAAKETPAQLARFVVLQHEQHVVREVVRVCSDEGLRLGRERAHKRFLKKSLHKDNILSLVA